MRNFFILVVLYCKKIDESTSLKTLLPLVNCLIDKEVDVKLIVWNNSPHDFDIGSARDIIIMGDGANHPLPHIYNRVAKFAQSNSSNFILMIADDDSNFSEITATSILEFLCYTKIKNFGILLPRVYSSNVLVSPARRIWFKGVRLDRIAPGEVVSQKLLAINSGMMLFSECIEMMPYLFDDRLFYYGTDTDFMVRYEKYFSHAYVLADRITHSLSEHCVESTGRTLFRWNDHFHAMRITFGSSRCSRGIINLYITYRRLMLALRYKCLSFMK